MLDDSAGAVLMACSWAVIVAPDGPLSLIWTP
ncbi:MAG: hypothetical protein QOF66_1183, partial [Mycobacterium sp.]|nr:hypothetical protein [Mycobacterium sp.]